MIPPVNSLTVYALGLQLEDALSGAAITGVRSFPDCVTICFESAPFKYAHVLYHRREPELVLSQREIAPRESGFEEMGMVIGRRVSGIRTLGLERVIVIRLAPGNEWGADGSLLLRIDLTPAAKPLSLYAESSGRPLAAIGAKRARRAAGPNEALPIRPYSIIELPAEPPAELLSGGYPDELPPSTPDHTRRWKHTKALASALVSMIGGVDPVLADVLSKQAGGDIMRVWPMLAAVADRIAPRAPAWHIYEFPEEGEAGKGALYPVELPIEARGERKTDFLEAIGSRADEVVIPSYIAHLRRKVATRIGRELKRLRRLGRNLEEDLDNAQRSAEFRHFGDLLVTYRHLLKTGMKEIVVRDFSGERDIAIPLDPARSPERNIRLYFTKAKKGEKGGHIIRNRKREIEREIAREEKRLERIAQLADSAELMGNLPREKPVRAAERDAGAARRFRHFRIDETHTVYVGRSDAENDLLTHEFASPTDLWFHAEGTSGSHVILKGANRSTPASVIERAASIAAYYSKARNSSTVPVIVAEKRHVRRPRKSKPGAALCSRGRTIFVKPALPDDT
jgi:hypothetical protein